MLNKEHGKKLIRHCKYFQLMYKVLEHNPMYPDSTVLCKAMIYNTATKLYSTGSVMTK